MYDARAIANFLIERSLSTGTGVTALSLLKILYFAHAWHLVKYSKPLVIQPFEAWEFGPVNRVVYDQIKKLKNQRLLENLTRFDPRSGAYEEATEEISADVIELLNNVFDYYSRFDGFTLSDLTHERGSPWDIIWKKAGTSAVPGMFIPDEMIRNWFGSRSAMPSRFKH